MYLGVAGVIEHAEAFNPVNMRKPRKAQEMRQELLIQANLVIIVFVNVAAKYHPHDKKAVFNRKRLAINEQAREDIEIRHTHVKDPGWNQHSMPLGQRRQEFAVVVEMLNYMRRINPLKCLVGEKAQVTRIGNVINDGSGIGIEHLPASRLYLSTNM